MRWIVATKAVNRRGYRSCVLILLNTIVVFGLFNLAILTVILIRDVLYSENGISQKTITHNPDYLFQSDGSPLNNGKRSPYQLEWFDFTAYEGISVDYADQVLNDFYELSKLGFIYQPWVQFSEPPFNGRRVNVDLDPIGFPIRRTINPPNDRHLPVVAIFVLGGSTTFGYNVSDEHTWPTYLSRILNEKVKTEHLNIHVHVVNYGRGFFNPSQEMFLLTDLLKSGHRPSFAVFMDGVNPSLTADVPWFTSKLSQHMKNMQFSTDTQLIDQIQWLPILRLATAIHRRFEDNSGKPVKATEPMEPRRIDYVVNSFQQNLELSRAIGNVYGIQTMFFLQPNALYNYPLELYRRPVPQKFLDGRHEATQVYRRLREKADRIYLGDLFESWGDNKAICDDVHYSPTFNRFLATKVAAHIPLKELKPSTVLIEDLAATGSRRDGHYQ